MTVLVILILLALVVGIGGLIKGLLWLALIGLVLLGVAAWLGYRFLAGLRTRR